MRTVRNVGRIVLPVSLLLILALVVYATAGDVEPGWRTAYDWTVAGILVVTGVVTAGCLLAGGDGDGAAAPSRG